MHRVFLSHQLSGRESKQGLGGGQSGTWGLCCGSWRCLGGSYLGEPKGQTSGHACGYLSYDVGGRRGEPGERRRANRPRTTARFRSPSPTTERKREDPNKAVLPCFSLCRVSGSGQRSGSSAPKQAVADPPTTSDTTPSLEVGASRRRGQKSVAASSLDLRRRTEGKHWDGCNCKRGRVTACKHLLS